MSELLGSGFGVYGQDAIDAANAAGVDPNLFVALIQSESGFNPGATNTNKNGTTDYGIAQLNSNTFPDAQHMTIKEQLTAAANYLAKHGVLGYKGSGPVAEANAANVVKLADKIKASGEVSATGNSITDFIRKFLVPSPSITGTNIPSNEAKAVANVVSSPVVDYLKTNGLPIAILIVAGSLIVFGLGSSIMSPSITIKG